MSDKPGKAPKEELWLGNTSYRDLVGLKIAVVSAVIGFAAGGLPILMSSEPNGAVYAVTYWIFILSFICMVAGGVWQVLVSTGIVKRLRERREG